MMLDLLREMGPDEFPHLIEPKPETAMRNELGLKQYRHASRSRRRGTFRREESVVRRMDRKRIAEASCCIASYQVVAVSLSSPKSVGVALPWKCPVACPDWRAMEALVELGVE